MQLLQLTRKQQGHCKHTHTHSNTPQPKQQTTPTPPGIPLSWFCACRALAALFLFVVAPAASLAGALYLTATGAPPSALPPGPWAKRRGAARAAALYRELLLRPAHWLATWRLNCLLIAWHSAVCGGSRGSSGSTGSANASSASSAAVAAEYALEDKGAFLLAAERAGLPAAPFVRAPKVFVKHRAVEGGQGIHVFRSFTAGGEWVVSEALDNAPCLARMLPPGAPLSTFRVVTASVAWLEAREAARDGGASGSPPGAGRQQQQEQQQQLGGGGGASPPQGRGPPPPPPARASTPGGSIRALLAGRRSRAGSRPGDCSPPLPVSTAVQRIAGGATPPPLLGDDDGTSDGDGGAASDDLDGARGWHSPTGASSSSAGGGGAAGRYERAIEVLTCVFRAGLAGADTDHASVCFPVDDGGELGPGLTAAHWYRTGLRGALRVAGGADEVFEAHPQSGFLVAGARARCDGRPFSLRLGKVVACRCSTTTHPRPATTTPPPPTPNTKQQARSCPTTGSRSPASRCRRTRCSRRRCRSSAGTSRSRPTATPRQRSAP